MNNRTANSPRSFEFSLPYIAVEGNSGIGKTTTASTLARRFNAPWFPEYYDYINWDIGEILPLFPPISKEEVCRSNMLWTELDIRREIARRNRQFKFSTFQIVDTTLLSVIGYEICKAKFGFPEGIAELSCNYLQLIRSGVLQEPSAWIFLTAPPIVISERIDARGGSRPFMKLLSTMDYIDKVRHWFACHFLAEGDYIMIDNGSCSLNASVEAACDFITKSKLNSGTFTGLHDFLTALYNNTETLSALLNL